MSDIRKELKYLSSHEWARVEEDGTVTIGITDHAQDALGDVVYVETPEVGSRVAIGEEAGVANYEVQEWNPVLAPAGLPKEERQRLFDALNKALKVPEVVSKVQALGGEVFPNTTDGLAAGFIKTQQVQWRRVIAARKIQAG